MEKEKKPDHYSVVAKDNSMVEKLAGFNLSELRLMAYCLAHFDSTDPENRSFRAHVSDFQKLFPLDKDEAYTIVKNTIYGINSNPLEVKEGDTKHSWIWFSGVSYTSGTGEFGFTLTPEILPYFLGLKGSFTKYRLEAVCRFKRAYTWKLYENLKKEAFKGLWSVGLKELKFFLGVPAEKYEKVYEFDRRIITPATAEINKLSDLEVSYEKQKKGRSIIGLVFKINEKVPEDVLNVETSRQAFARLLAIEGINKKTIEKYVELAEKHGRIEKCIAQLPRIVNRWNQNKGPKNKYLLGALKSEMANNSLFDDQETAPPTKIKIDFSIYGKEELDLFEKQPGYGADVRAEKKRRGLV